MNPSPSTVPIKNALISTSDKTALLPLAEALISLQINILATGRSAQYLLSQGISVTEISDYTGLPEMMEGRVKTLHHKIHAGILARRGVDDALLEEQQILPIDLLIVNLYPFEQCIQDPLCSLKKAVEYIDIGGPTLLRGAAKNYDYVTAIVDPSDYEWVLSEIKNNGGTSLTSRQKLAQKIFAYVSHYDACIARYLERQSQSTSSEFPATYQASFQKKTELRYGENPHQRAAWYMDQSQTGLAHAKQLQGKELSFNNVLDSDAAINCVQDLDPKQTACVIVKHGSPCGAACAEDQLAAYQKAYTTDANSAFGGIIAFNTPLTYLTAEAILAQQFVEVILAPAIDPEVLNLLRTKTNVRVLVYIPNRDPSALSHHSISGGLLLQEKDLNTLDPAQLITVTQRAPTSAELRDLLFAWSIVKWAKSNAIVYAKNQSTLGIGTGQTSRVFSAEIGILKAHHAELNLKGAVMASDAFFPFADGMDLGIAAGVTAVIQPGGSKNDPELIAAADKAGIAMLMTGLRHFRH